MHTQNKIKIFAFLTLSIFIFAFFIPSKANASQFFFDSSSQKFGVGDEFKVDLNLNTENQKINAVEGDIIFPQDILELSEIRDGNSIVNFWVEQPKAQTGGVRFSGIIAPGGFEGNKGLILSLIFKTKSEGAGSVGINNFKTLLNDGVGTLATSSVSIFNFSASKDITASNFIGEKDTVPPEIFQPVVSVDPNVFDGKYFLVFATQDKDSGIDHYEVCEGSKNNCITATSPHVLVNQKLDQDIYVKAVDKAGNVRLGTLPAPFPIPWYKNYTFLAIILVLVAFVVSLGRNIWSKFLKHR